MSKHLSHSKMDRWMNQVAMPEHSSIKPLILAFSMGNSSSEIGCAHLMMLLAGYPVPLPQATLGFDLHRMSWFIRAMMEYLDEDEWPGIAQAELEQVWKKHPYLRTKAEAAEKAWTS
ncbi:hypothetical protein CO655_12040 [Rhizobium sp. M1]|nr:hypothetical protein CO655_12040 [Rhizobium sp. M1]